MEKCNGKEKKKKEDKKKEKNKWERGEGVEEAEKIILWEGRIRKMLRK